MKTKSNFLNKPAGVLSQKAKETDVSLTEALGAYLSEKMPGRRPCSAPDSAIVWTGTPAV